MLRLLVRTKLVTLIFSVLFVGTLIGGVALLLFNEGVDKCELANRAVCVSNIKVLGKAIQDYQKAHGQYPTKLADLKMNIPTCPSACSGDPKVDANYVWSAQETTLTEGTLNHDKRRLGLERAKSVRHAISLQKDSTVQILETDR